MNTIQTNRPLERHKVVRSGPRAPISGYKRGLIYARDGFHCAFCGAAGNFNLDHVVPWSAGGSDAAVNLRLLCEACNQDRSNYKTMGDDRLRLPVLPDCFECRQWSFNPDRVEDDEFYDGPDRSGWVLVYCGRCEITRADPEDVEDFEEFERVAVPIMCEEQYRAFLRIRYWMRAVGRRVHSEYFPPGTTYLSESE
jgi:hypothetical protein